MKYSIGKDTIFIILALIASLALLAEHPIISIVFFLGSLLFVYYEHDIYAYVKSA